MMGVQAAGGGVLLISVDEPAGRSLVSALEAATIQAEWARSLDELHSRAARADACMPALVFLDLESLIDAYAADRMLSKQQRMILRSYLDGRNDKAIAELRGCSEATVYEHWRRMAKKVGGAHKGDAIADFHRFLATM